MAAKTDPKPFSIRLARMIASGGGLGYLPKAPGTWGSLAACIIAWPMAVNGGPLLLFLAVGLALVIGLWAGAVCLRCGDDSETASDPSWIVIDEMAGQWLTLAVVPPELFYYILGFFVFRGLDILKPPPINWVESWPGSWGIMADDLVAGGLAAILLWLII